MRRGQRVLISAALGVLLAGAGRLGRPIRRSTTCCKSPVGKDWVTNGGNLTNERYSTLKQIDTSNVKQLKGAWMTRLKGSGYRRQVFVRRRRRWSRTASCTSSPATTMCSR